jgi:DNA invertase Pin-like site-specific DNA recombinase
LKVALYARVSSDDQNVSQQLVRLRSFAKGGGWVIGAEVADEESGRKPLVERESFKELLARREDFDAVVVFNTDRLTRNWADEAFLEEAFSSGRCRLVSMSDSVDLRSASGRLMFRLKMAVACFMPEDMREKQVVGIERAKEEGKYRGGKKGRRWKK